METTVKVNLPQNLSIEDAAMFESFQSYSIGEQTVKYLNNVFVAYSGFCKDEYGVIKESHHAYPDMEERLVKNLQFFDEAIAISPELLLELDDDNTYLLIHHSWFTNYYHWICEGILRLWLVKDRMHEMILLLPETLKNIEFIMSALEPFCFKEIRFMPTYQCLQVKNLCLPQIKPICDSYDTVLVNEIREFYRQYSATKTASSLKMGKKIFLSRKKSTQRKIVNEAEVEALMIKHGFQVVYNEDLSFWEQVSVYANANCLVSIHGAGLTNMIFMEDNSTILELHKRKTNAKDWHSLAYWYLADALNFTYYHQICDPRDKEEHFFTADFIVDTDKLEVSLAKFSKC